MGQRVVTQTLKPFPRIFNVAAEEVAEKLTFCHSSARRAPPRGISLFRCTNQGEIPHFVRNDKINYFFRSL